MNDPYRVLDLPLNASESEIRRRYLELVRKFPPDQAPERFAAIHAAYASLRDPATRLKEQLFSLQPKEDSFESIAAELHARLKAVRIPTDVLLSWAELS
jgi:curved DNA-binding protein CbpA